MLEDVSQKQVDTRYLYRRRLSKFFLVQADGRPFWTYVF